MNRWASWAYKSKGHSKQLYHQEILLHHGLQPPRDLTLLTFHPLYALASSKSTCRWVESWVRVFYCPPPSFYKWEFKVQPYSYSRRPCCHCMGLFCCRDNRWSSLVHQFTNCRNGIITLYLERKIDHKYFRKYQGVRPVTVVSRVTKLHTLRVKKQVEGKGDVWYLSKWGKGYLLITFNSKTLTSMYHQYWSSPDHPGCFGEE